MWFHWIIDFGLPGPDRGEGGRFLLIPPGYDGPLPDSGFHVAHSRTNRVIMLGRSFMEDNDPKPTVELIKNTLKLYPYVPGGYGSSVATLLKGEIRLAAPSTAPETKFIEASDKAFNTIPPSDFRFFELLNEVIQNEPADATDHETMGQLAAIGIVKGKPFAPDERKRKILEEAAKVGNATARALMFAAPDSEEVQYYPGSAWTNMLFPAGYTFDTPRRWLRPRASDHSRPPVPAS